MTDQDDAANLTIGPGGMLPPPAPEDEAKSRQTMLTKAMGTMASAIDHTQARRAAQKEATNPYIAWVTRLLLRGLVGMPAAWFGSVWTFEAKQTLDKKLNNLQALDINASLHARDFLVFFPGGVALFIAFCLLMPEQAEALFRALKLGTLLDRIPFLRPLPPSPPDA